jgi:hypothetical protein
MIKMELERIRIVIVKCLFVVLLVQFGCRQKSHGLDTVKPKDMPKDSVKLISKLWKADSLGCLQLRDPRKIKRLIKQVDLIGKDSLAVQEYLGRPNLVSFLEGKKIYAYRLECIGEKKISYSNFYCIFEGQLLRSCHHSTF